jgi:putative acetyltransferase
LTTRIEPHDPRDPAIALLMARHTADMHADTPPESIHMMDAGQLAVPGIWFFVMWDEMEPVGMGAFKRIDETHAEIKSMHVLIERRGQGLSRKLLDHLVAQALSSGFHRLSLETGSQDMFGPARGLYLKAGFTECPPFQGYVADPNSVFMTRTLA